MYEHREHPPIPRAAFLRRMLAHAAVATALVIGSLLLGMLGYVGFEHRGWIDAFLDSAMLLGGMGPVWAPRTPGGKIFAGLFALYSGLVFLVCAGVIAAPLLHRLLHRFHWK
ncbi:MAG: hypothetical protein U1F14_02845 [Steroidobacteraceae bacterium]